MNATGESSEVQFGNTLLAYAIQRSPRRGTVSIAVDPRQGLVLTAPLGVSRERLSQVVRRKAPWILGQLRRQRGLGRVPRREFVSGETVWYLGRQYRLRLPSGRRRQGAKLVKGWLLTSAADPRKDLEAWFRRHAQGRLTETVARWSAKMHRPVPRVLIRSQAKRWASCDVRGDLRFNWRIIQAPTSLIDYVVVHELLHQRHRNHTVAFWRDLGHLMPDYETRRCELRQRGHLYEW